MLSEKGVLRNFVKFTGKHLCQSLFLIKFKACTFIKKRLWHRCFPVNFAKFLRTTFLTEHLRWLLLHVNNSKAYLCGQRNCWHKQLYKIYELWQIMKPISITSEITAWIRKWNQFNQFRWISNKVIPIEDLSWVYFDDEPRVWDSQKKWRSNSPTHPFL